MGIWPDLPYIEHGRKQLTTVDVTEKQHPEVVNHDPAQVQPTRYEQLKGGVIEVSPPRYVSAGVNNVGGRKTFTSPPRRLTV
jgi:hypothetical protein